MVAPLFPLWAWLVFGGLVLALLILDLFVLHRNAREVPFKEAIWLSVFWIAVSLTFGGFVWRPVLSLTWCRFRSWPTLLGSG